jgi:hypothetical protein
MERSEIWCNSPVTKPWIPLRFIRATTAQAFDSAAIAATTLSANGKVCTAPD